MAKGLLTNTLGFEILPTSNNKVFLFLDTSDYFEQPELPMLMIHPPGFKKFFQVNINYGQLNVISSNTMGWTDILETSDLLILPDGVWKFSYMICPYEDLQITKYVLRTNLLDANLSKIYAFIDTECILDDHHSCVRKDLIDIHILIESAKANCELNQPDKAAKEFSLAQKKVKTLFENVLND